MRRSGRRAAGAQIRSAVDDVVARPGPPYGRGGAQLVPAGDGRGARPPLYYTKESPDDDWDGARADDALVAEAWQAWRDEVAFAEQYVDRTEDLGTMGTHHGEAVPLRDVLVHMIEEYARHCGHADLLRECIDGRVGQ